MRIDTAALGLVISAVSTLVVVVGALAAVRQLRYIRQGNELQTLEGLNREWMDDRMLADREFIMHDVPALIDDAEFLGEFRLLPVGPRAYRVVRVLAMLERVSAYRHAGALSDDLSTIMWATSARDHWKAARPLVAVMRSAREVRFYEHLEDFAMQYPELIERYARRRRRLRRDPAIADTPGVSGAGT